MDGLKDIAKTVQECISNVVETVASNDLKCCLVEIQNWLDDTQNSEAHLLEKYKFMANSALTLFNEVRFHANNSIRLYGVIFHLITCLPNDETESDKGVGQSPTGELAAAMKTYGSMNWLKIKLKIALKYSRLLLLSHDYPKAAACLKFSEKNGRLIFKNLSARTSDNKFSLANSSTRVETHHDLIVCYLYQTETFSASANYEEARKAFQNVKEMLTDFINVKDYMIALCFNIGLDLYRLEKYEESAFWLTQSYEAGKSTINSNESRTLMLLAEAYLQWNGKLHYHDALNALQLADKENANWECNFLKLKAYVEGSAPIGDIQDAAHHCCQTIELSQDKGLQIIETLLKSGHKNLASTTMHTLENILSSSNKADEIFEQHLKLSLEEDLLSDAEEVVKRYIVCCSDLNGSTKILAKVENQASLLKESKRYVKAIAWFDFCIQIVTNCHFEHADELSLVKFYHQKCSCLLESGWYNEAHETLILAEKCAPHHVLNDYLKLKLCIAQNDDNEATKLVQSICVNLKSLDESDDIAEVLVLCAEFGLRKSKFQTTVNLLENVIGKMADASATLTALRYLLKLKLRMQCDFTNQSGREWLLAFSTNVCQTLESVSMNVWCVDQAKWFLKMMWNLAHLNKENPLVIHKLLSVCNKIFKACDIGDTAAILQRISCLLSSVTAGLQIIRSNPSEDETAELLREILEGIEDLKKLCNAQNDLICNTVLQNAFKSTRCLVLISEFEAKARTHSHDLENVFEAILSLPDIDAKTFELLAVIANGQHCYSLTVRSLKASIGKHLEVVPLDYEYIGRLYHSLLCIVLPKMESNRTYENDFGKFLGEIHDLVKLMPNDKFPQSELLWFMTKAWNVSIKIFLQYGHNSEALNWLQLAIGLADHLVSRRDFYQNQMNALYGRLLSEPSVNREAVEI